MTHVFISYARADSEEAHAWESWLKSADRGHTVFIDRKIPTGADWEREIYQQIKSAQAILLIVTPDWHESKWCFAEFALARTFGKNIFPIFPQSAPPETKKASDDIQHFDARKANWEEARQRLGDEIGALLQWDPARTPFPGLLPFNERDAAVFFGRDDEAIELVEHLNRFPTFRLVALLGASGAGKSSLLRAGVIPRLKVGNYRDRWVALQPFYPTDDPIRELALAMASALGEAEKTGEYAAKLKGKDRREHLKTVAERFRDEVAREVKILVPIDQAEELFYTTPVEQRQAFMGLLSTLFLLPDSPFVVLMALRSEYLDALQSGVKDFIKPLVYSLAPLSVDRWREVIEGPAKAAGLEVENALIDQAKADAETEDALPLLAIVLHTLYEKHITRRNRGEDNTRQLKAADYEALGNRHNGISPLDNNVREVADNVFKIHGDNPAVLNALREVFVAALVQINDKNEFVRRRAEWETVPKAARPLLDELTKQRLVVTGEEDGHRFVEVAHEALLRKWPLLNGWLEEEREFLTDRRRIQHALEDWTRTGEVKKSAALLQGLLLERARKWMNSHCVLLTETERRYIEDSIAAEDATQAHAKKQKDLIFRLTVGGLSVASILAMAASYAAWQAMRSAETTRQQRDEALVVQSRLLSTLSHQATQSGDPTKGILLSIEALPGDGPSGKRPYTEEPEISLYAAYAANRQQHVLAHGDGSPVGLALFSPDSTRLLTALGPDKMSSESAPARLWDTHSGAQSIALEGTIANPKPGASAEELAHASWRQAGMARALTNAVFSRDSTRILTVLAHSMVKLWDVKSGASTVAFTTHKGRIMNATFSPDENYVIVEFQDKDNTGFAMVDPESKVSGTLRLSDSKTGAELDEINGVAGLKRIVFSPDGARLVTQTKNDELTLWDARGRRPIATLKGHQREVTSLAFSPDGSVIATTSSDQTARLWEASTGKELAVLQGHEDAVTFAVFAPSGEKLLTTSADKTARLWKMTPGNPPTASVFRGHKTAILDAAFNADGSRIITRSTDNTSRLWNAHDTSNLTLFQGNEQGSTISSQGETAVFSSDGLRVLSFPNKSSFLGYIRLWDAESGKLVGELGKADITPSFSPDGTRVLTTSSETGVRLWETATGKLSETIAPPGNRLTHASFSPDGTMVSTVSDDTATLWDARTGAHFAARTNQEIGKSPNSAFEVYSPDRTVVLREVYGEGADFRSKRLKLVDVANNKEIAFITGHEKPITSKAFSSTGTRILTASEDGTARIWSTQTGAELTVLRGHAGGFRSAAFSADDQWIVTVGDDGARLWKTRGGRQVAVLSKPDIKVLAAIISPDNENVVTLSTDQIAPSRPLLHLWDLNGRLRAELKGHEGKLTALAFSRDGTRMAIGSDDKALRIWNVTTGKQETVLNGHDSAVTGAIFSPDGTRIVTLAHGEGSERKLTFWDAKSGQTIKRFPTLQSEGILDFSADGTHMVTTFGAPIAGGAVTLWDAITGEQIAAHPGKLNADGSRELLHDPINNTLVVRAPIERSPVEPVMIKGHSDNIRNYLFNFDGTKVITAADDGTARIWNANTGAPMATLQGHKGAVRSAVFNWDGSLAVTASDDGTASIWDAATGVERKIFEVNRGALLHASFSLDGERVVTLSEDHTLRQWNSDNGTPLSVLALDEDFFKETIARGKMGFRGITTNSAGTRALLLGFDKHFLLRTFPSTGALVAEAKRAVPRCLTPSERQKAYLEPAPPLWCIEQSKWPYHTLRWKSWLAMERAGRNAPYPDPEADKQAADRADEAFRAGRFTEAMNLQEAFAESFSQATTSIPGGEPSAAARVFSHLARYALFSKDYSKSLSAAERALSLEPDMFLLLGTPDLNAFINKAHALMFSGRIEEALAIHRKHRGETINAGDLFNSEFSQFVHPDQEKVKRLSWEDGVRADFARFRELGMEHPQMAVIEKALAASP